MRSQFDYGLTVQIRTALASCLIMGVLHTDIPSYPQVERIRAVFLAIHLLQHLSEWTRCLISSPDTLWEVEIPRLEMQRSSVLFSQHILYSRKAGEDFGGGEKPRQRAERHCFATNIASDTKCKKHINTENSPLYVPSIPLPDLLHLHPYAPGTRRINLVNPA